MPTVLYEVPAARVILSCRAHAVHQRRRPNEVPSASDAVSDRGYQVPRGADSLSRRGDDLSGDGDQVPPRPHRLRRGRRRSVSDVSNTRT